MSQEFEVASPFATERPSLFYPPHRRPISGLPLPTAREWGRHAFLFFLTTLTAIFAGICLAAPLLEPSLAEPARWVDYLSYVPLYYVLTIWLLLQEAFHHPHLLAQGVKFAASLLAILTAHEAGHYIACRRYGVYATLPFFLPAPPLFLAGTFGAFIKIKSPIPSKRALFDIGLAGPLAGFVVALPIAALAYLTAQPAPFGDGNLLFHEPLLFQALGFLFGVDSMNIEGNPFWFASWIGLLVTSLNLLPVGQLDGGHGVYAVFGRRVHYWLGRAAFLSMCALTVFGLIYHGTPSGLLYSILLFFVLRAGHPQVEDEDEPLGRARMIVALLTLLVFLLCFLPFPISVL